MSTVWRLRIDEATLEKADQVTGRLGTSTQEMVRLLTRTFCNDCRIIIAPTDKVSDLLKEYGIRRPIRIIPSGLKLERFTSVAGVPE